MLNLISENQSEIIKFLFILIIGFIVIKIIVRIIEKATRNPKMDLTIGKFLLGLIKFMLYTAYIIVLLSTLGVPMTTFIAMLSAIALAIALALQGNLSNFSSALVILFFKPFKVGDFIETVNNIGTVQEIQLLFTYLLTPDNKRVIIPNSDLVNVRVVNYSAERTRRIDLVFTAGYEDDMDMVINTIKDITVANDKILIEPAPVVRLLNHGLNALEYDVKIWILKEDFWEVKYYMNEEVRRAFDEKNIKIPYPQRELWFNKSGHNLDEL